MFTIFIDRLKVFGHIGVYDFEKKNGQNFLIWAQADIDDERLCDDIETSVDYTKLVSSLEGLVRDSRCDLLEVFLKNALKEIMCRFPSIVKMRARICKESAPIDAELCAVGVSASLKRSTVYLSLGSNIGDRTANLKTAVAKLGALESTRVESVSNVYETSPVDCGPCDDYLNCCVKVSTLLSPRRLLHLVLETESEMGRERPYKNAPRVIDIDMLLYDDVISLDEELILPHPRMLGRKFVLVPLLDIYDSSLERRLYFSDALSCINSEDTVKYFCKL
ncbi:MAG: 2-amino-4-hydroxy-6-hydroxymethyldihydropteridine diphosphokinase [Clostridia bacterium]|nr:2-amino-4-hydroxy-6-hydroxymethyldihydropteridine diphosphokinase [Clostridia bacterium]